MNYNKIGNTKRISKDEFGAMRDGNGHVDFNRTLNKVGTASDRSKLEQAINDIKNETSPESIAWEIEQSKIFRAKVATAYEAWLKEDHVALYKGHEPVINNNVIIRVFNYTQKATTGNTIILDTQLTDIHKIFPVVKIVASNDIEIEVGDIYRIPAAMGKNVISQEWIQYQKDIREKPSLKDDVPEPPMYIGRLNQWVDKMYQLDSLSETTTDDQHTFCVPSTYLQARIK